MARALFILIDSDPASNGRPAEAFRVATGIAVGRSGPVGVVFSGPAARAWITGEQEGFLDWLNGDQLAQNLPVYLEAGGELFLHRRSEDAPLAQTSRKVVEAEMLAQLLAEARAVLRF